MAFSKKNIIIEFLLIYLSIGILLPAFKAYTGIPAFWPAIALVIVYSFAHNPIIFFRSSMLIAIAILLIYTLQQFSGKYEFRAPFGEGIKGLFYAYIAPVVLVEIIIYYKNDDFTWRLGKLALLFLVISSTIQLLAEITHPLISRLQNEALSKMSYPWWVVITPFGTINAIPIIIGILVFTIRKKAFHIICLILLIMVILISGYFTALVYMILIIGAALLIRFSKNKFYFYLFFSISLVFIIAFKGEFLQIGQYIPNSIAQDKIAGIQSKLSFGSGNSATDIREQVYQTSLDGFLNNVFWGQKSASKTGQHSYWLDKLSQFGFLGTIPYALFIIIMYKRSLKILPPNLHYVYKFFFIITSAVMIFNPYDFLEFFVIIFAYTPAIAVFLANPVHKPNLAYRISQNSAIQKM